MPDKRDKDRFHFHTGGPFANDGWKTLHDRVNKAQQAFRDGTEQPYGVFADSALDMPEINPRPKPTSNDQTRVKIIAQRDNNRHTAAIYVFVPNAFGRLEALLDGETGEPVDFGEELGDPRAWRTDRSVELEAIAKRAGATCAALFRSRVPA